MSVCLGGILSIICLLLAATEVTADPLHTLYHTSFEGTATTAFSQRQEGEVLLTATGTANISTSFAHGGSQCLHLLGDEHNSVVFHLPENLQNVRGLSFYAERWTARDPFSLAVDVQQQGKWREIAALDQVVQGGRRFLTHVQLPIEGTSPTTAIRLRTRAAPQSGVLLDDFALHRESPDSPTLVPTRSVPSEPLPLLDRQTLFAAGMGGVHTYRIPAIITAANGDLIAACDARRENAADLIKQRTIDIVFRRSSDNGQTWSQIEVLDSIADGGCSDPSFLLDWVTKEIFCFYNYMASDLSNRRYRFLVQKSLDHGKSWGPPKDVTDQIRSPALTDEFVFVTSGRGIQLRNGVLMHNFVHVGKGATVFCSEDHGVTWKAVGRVSPADESKLVELPDERLMMNSRHLPGARQVHRSPDGGKTWESVANLSLPDPQCNAAILQYTAQHDGFGKDRLLFCNAASNVRRENLAVRISYDHGHRWSDGRVIDPGPAAYSEMTVLLDGTIGVLYEPGYQEIRFARFTLESLTGGEDRLPKPYTPPPVSAR
jgi:hypothetical protein